MSLNEAASDKLMDHRFRVFSYEQYLKDLETLKFNKMCMTEVINADLMIATFGEKQYCETSAAILAMGNAAYAQMGIGHLIHVYIHTYKTFIAVANEDMSDDDFLGLMKANHEQYEFITSQQTGLGGVSRFVVAFGDNLVDRARSAFYLNRNLPDNFFVVKNEWELMLSETEKRNNMFDLINHALANDKVVPYYQAIYDNQLGKPAKYEALMRIFDQNGKLCPPGMFLQAAKELKLYLPLSKIMIDKALHDFAQIPCELSINISLLDVQSPDFKDWLLERIHQHPDPRKLFIEFVETENYNNEDLFDFLRQVRALGCKIAVDDFGVGYATYSSIVSLKPDIIKIDGDIIKTLVESEESRLILKSIKFMADLVHASTVAEFVENEAIQAIVYRNGISHSQGYHFAKPEPLEALNLT